MFYYTCIHVVISKLINKTRSQKVPLQYIWRRTNETVVNKWLACGCELDQGYDKEQWSTEPPEEGTICIVNNRGMYLSDRILSIFPILYSRWLDKKTRFPIVFFTFLIRLRTK